jgi:Mg/Co/Ni transporter MgtE
LHNVFGTEAAVTLLLFKIEPCHWGVLKSFLKFLSMITQDELVDVEEDETVEKILEKL